MKTIYINIKNRLKTEVTSLKWIDLNKQQMRFDKPPVTFPACLIDLYAPKTNNITTTLQQGTLLVKINLCFDWTGDRTSNAFSDEVAEDSLQYFDTVEEATKALQGFETDEFNELERINVSEPFIRQGYKVIEVSFTSSFRESFD